MNFDLEELAAIIEQLDQTEFTDFRFEHGDLRLHVSRGGSGAGIEPFAAPADPPAPVPAPAPEPASAPATPDAAPDAASASGTGLDP